MWSAETRSEPFILGAEQAGLGESFASVIADRIVGLVGLFWLVATRGVFASMTQGLSAVLTGTANRNRRYRPGELGRRPWVSHTFVQMMPPRVSRYASFIVTYLEHRATLLTALALSVVVQSLLAV